MNGFSIHRADALLLGISLVAALLIGVLMYAFAPVELESGKDVQPSSVFNDKHGAKALFRVWHELGYDVNHLRRPMMDQTLDDYDALVVLRPVREIDKDEAQALLRWVGRGGRLLIAPRESTLRQWFNPTMFEVKEHEENAVAEVPPADRAVRGQELVEGPEVFTGVRAITTRPLVRLDPDEPLDDVFRGGRTRVIWKDGYGVVALTIEYQRGAILALGDTYAMSNLGLREADNPVFAANLAAFVSQGDSSAAIAFDEFHHGFTYRQASAMAILALIVSDGRGWGIAQLAIVGLLTLWFFGRRFGRPRDVVFVKRRSHVEFIDAAARLLADARAAKLVNQTLLRHHRHRLCQLAHYPPDTDDTTLARIVKELVGHDVAWALEEAKYDAAVKDGRVLQIHQTLSKAVEALEHGTR